MKKNSILWIFSDVGYLDRYSGLFESLANKGICVKILLSVFNPDHDSNNIKLKYKHLDIKTFKHDKKLYMWEQILNYSRIKNHTHLSISFVERYKFIVPSLREIWLSFLKDKKRKGLRITLKQIPQKYKLNFLINLIGAKFIHRPLHFIVHKLFIRHAELSKLINCEPERLVFFTYQGPHAETNALMRICNKLNKKTIFLQHNWDNLSSKELLYLKPDILGVWSYQCSVHAATIQRIPEQNIRILGNYLIDHHIGSLEESCYGDRGYILYLGDSTDMDEHKIIKTISDYLQLYNEKTGRDLSCYYRPHPYVNKKKYTEANLPEYIRIDPAYEGIYFGKVPKLGTLYFTNTKSLSAAIKYAEWVIAGGTTAFIEACLHEKKVMLVDAPMRSVYALSKTHFHGVNGMQGVTIVRQEDFSIQSLQLFIEKSQTGTSLDDPRLKYFYENRSPTAFVDKLTSLIDELQSLN
jgi:hypothetical protein